MVVLQVYGSARVYHHNMTPQIQWMQHVPFTTSLSIGFLMRARCVWGFVLYCVHSCVHKHIKCTQLEKRTCMHAYVSHMQFMYLCTCSIYALIHIGVHACTLILPASNVCMWLSIHTCTYLNTHMHITTHRSLWISLSTNLYWHVVHLKHQCRTQVFGTILSVGTSTGACGGVVLCGCVYCVSVYSVAVMVWVYYVCRGRMYCVCVCVYVCGVCVCVCVCVCDLICKTLVRFATLLHNITHTTTSAHLPPPPTHTQQRPQCIMVAL